MLTFFFFLGVTFYLGNYDSFIHSVLSLLNLFFIKELSFCMWMFCFMKWAMLLWFLLFILLCYNVKLGKHLVVYTWIWFGIWCLLLIKAKFFFFFFFLFLFMNFMVLNGKPSPKKKKKKLSILPLYRISYLVFLLFYWFQYLFYFELLSAFSFLFYYGLPALPLILLLNISNFLYLYGFICLKKCRWEGLTRKMIIMSIE